MTTETDLRPYLKRDLGYNYLPEPFREATLSEFLWSLSIYSPSEVGHRQVWERNDDGVGTRIATFKIFWFYDCAIAVEIKYDGKATRSEIDAFTIGKIYRIGCDHKWRTINREECLQRDIWHGGRCWHVTECTECGMMRSYDSSD